MRLPIIKHLSNFIENNDEDFMIETLEVLEDLTEASTLKDEELDVIGELLSNMHGAVEVNKLMREEEISQKEATKKFMDRVTGSIDK
jgi:hypothetical protein